MWIDANSKSVFYRLALVPVFVALCYGFDWRWLCSLTAAALVEISKALGIPMHQIDRDMVELGGVPIHLVVACTMVDAFFGAVPLMWRPSVSLMRNGLRLMALFIGVSLLNIVRLEAGFVALNIGVPWWLAHECVAGIAYFCLLMFLIRNNPPPIQNRLQYLN